MDKKIKIEFTESQVKNMAEFIEFHLLDVIRKDDDIDNILWVHDMCEAYHILMVAQHENKKSTEDHEFRLGDLLDDGK